MLTWDLGAGPRRIFTKRPVDERYFVHSVQFGRYGRLGYLQVDNFPNITGRAPGLRENLNITSKVKMSIFIIWRKYSKTTWTRRGEGTVVDRVYKKKVS